MASTARIDELKKKFDENPRRYFAPLANEFRKAGDIEQAILICEEFLPQQPAHMSGHIVYGQALYEAGRFPESRIVFETALGLDPENLIALRHLGDIARGQHDGAAARGWYVRVLDADPRNEEIQSLIAGLDRDLPAAPLFELEPMHVPTAPASSMDLAIEKEVPPLDGLSMHEVPSRSLMDPSLVDTTPVGVPIVPAAPVAQSTHAPDLLDGFSLHGFGDESDESPGRRDQEVAEGLEFAEFTSPSEHVPAAELDASLETGVPSFASPAHPVESLTGLQGSGVEAHVPDNDAGQRHGVNDFAALDLEGGLLLPTASGAGDQGSVSTPTSSSTTEAASAHEGFDDIGSEMVDDWSTSERPEGRRSRDLTSATEASNVVPMELPPEVIAAEAALITAGETPPPEIMDEEDDAPEVVARPPFVTETMAELYLAQGFHEQALSVYSDLLAANPGDSRLSDIVLSLSPVHHEAEAGPSVRDFLSRIASRRPAHAAVAHEPPADDDFLAEAATAEAPALDFGDFAEEDATNTAAAPSGEAAAISEPGADEPPSDGSIDALFGNRMAATSEDSAAAALAQAFGGGSDAAAPLPIVGRPAHTASGELSLDSVFREGAGRAPRTSQSFSFDQFFAGAEERSGRVSPPRGVATSPDGLDTPAERGADDIEQFNSWLQGLKQR